MDRRVRVKCPSCQAAIELKVGTLELVDVHCPRCRHKFTARVPAPAPSLSVEMDMTAEMDADTEMIQSVEEPPVSKPRPRRVRTVPQRSGGGPSAPAQTPYTPNPQLPAYGYSAQPGNYARPSGSADSVVSPKAFIIASVSVLALGLLVGLGILVSSMIANLPIADNSSATEQTQLPPTTNVRSADATGDTQAAFHPNSMQPAVVQPFTTSPADAPSVAGPRFDPSETGEHALAERIIEQAEILGRATLSGDVEFIADQTYPVLLTRMGGRASMIETTRKSLEMAKSNGTILHSYRVERNVTIRRANGKLFVAVPTSREMTVGDSRMSSQGYLLAISEDNGQTFTFLDGSGVRDPQLRRAIVPDLPADFPLPAVTDPKLL